MSLGHRSLRCCLFLALAFIFNVPVAQAQSESMGFTKELLVDKTIIWHTDIAKQWLPHDIRLGKFISEGSATLTERFAVTGIRSHPLAWRIENDELKTEQQIVTPLNELAPDYLRKVLGEESSTSLLSYIVNLELSIEDFSIVQNTSQSWQIVETDGEQIVAYISSKSHITLRAPEQYDLEINTSAEFESNERVRIYIDIENTHNDINDDQITGEWLLSLKYDWFGREGIYADKLQFSDLGMVSGKISNHNLSRENKAKGLNLVDNQRRFEIRSIQQFEDAHLVWVRMIENDQLVITYAELMTKYSESSMEELLDFVKTDLPVVINSDNNENLTSNWNNGQPEFGSACCFAYHFGSLNKVIFGLTDEINMQTNVKSFRSPIDAYHAKYSVESDTLIINYVVPDLRYTDYLIDEYHLYHWQPVSIDKQDRRLVLDYAVHRIEQDHVGGDSSGTSITELGLLAPRLTILNKVDLSMYADAFSNSNRAFGKDTDFDGIPDDDDLDDDNDGEPDASDAFPLDSRYKKDTDNDGIANLIDDDDDDDGIVDVFDPQPLGFANIMFYNSLKRKVWEWEMNGMPITRSSHVFSWGNAPAWHLVATGDFNGDGRPDLLRRNSITGRNWIKFHDVYVGYSDKTHYGFEQGASQHLNYVVDQDWQIKGTGDFDGDGKDDIIWRHVTRGDTWVYLMNGAKIRVSQPLRKVYDQNWQIVTTGDFNGDGQDDIVWRHSARGDNYIWLMDKGDLKHGYVLNTIPNPDWIIAGAGDLNGDGTDDIIWRNQSDGRNWAYLMVDGQIQTSQLINIVQNTNWQIADIQDLDGDGNADLFWHQKASNRTYIYLMQGLSIVQQDYSQTLSPGYNAVQ